MDDFKSMVQLFNENESRSYKEKLNQYLQVPCNESAKNYIVHYFASRSKSSVFEIDLGCNINIFEKASHMLSMFLLGIACSHFVKNRIERMLRINTKLSVYKFEYPWMLSCLYHDILSDYENRNEKFENLIEYIEKNDIQYDIYNTSFLDSVEVSRIPTTYKKKTVEMYFSYMMNSNDSRKKDMYHRDHGITSGYILYDRLVKNYLSERKKHNDEDSFWTQKGDRSLHWCKDQIWVFGYAADTIIAHNIWHQEADSGLPLEITKDCSLEKKLSIKETPLAFLCAVVDTIEPIKFFRETNHKIILENIKFKITKDSIIITQSEEKLFDLKNWYNIKMTSFSDWMSGITAEYNDDMITIKINGEK